MDHRVEARDFLTLCRARLQIGQVALPGIGERRVPGLRREEVAALAGVSVHYYTRLERGDLTGASASVLEALARALQLNDAEREHLFNLAAAATPHTRPRSAAGSTPRSVPRGVQQMLDAMTDAPAELRTYRRDVLAANSLGRALYSPMYQTSTAVPNAARYTFLEASAREFFIDWDQTADAIVANLRVEAGRNPRDRALSDLIGELVTRSDEFRIRWGAHHVRHHESGVKRLRHPLVGELELRFQVMQLPSKPGLGVLVHSAEPGSPSQDALRFLASLAAGHPAHIRPPTAQEPTANHQPHTSPTTSGDPQ